MFHSLSKFFSVALKHPDKTPIRPSHCDGLNFHTLSPSASVTIDEDIESISFSIPRSNLVRHLRELLAKNPSVSVFREDELIETRLPRESRPSRMGECPILPKVPCGETSLMILDYLNNPIPLGVDHACMSSKSHATSVASDATTKAQSPDERLQRRRARRQRRESNRILADVRACPIPTPIPISEFSNPQSQTRHYGKVGFCKIEC